jgi:starch synthase
MNRALDLYYDEPAIFQQLAQQGMQYDHSWRKSGQEYIKMYDYIRHK